MTLKQYLIIMILGTIMCWASWWLVILNIDPESAGTVGFSFFYGSLFLALLGTGSVLFFSIHRIFVRKQLIPMHHTVQKSFLEGLLMALLLIGLLYLQGEKFLQWWNAGVLGAVVVFLILFKLTSKKSRKEFSQDT